MRMPRTRRYSAAFTLVEVLVAATILVVMVGFMIVVMDQTTRIWSGSSAKVEQFREARSAFERVSTRLSQATLNTYWAYDDDKKPTRYLRQSELRFIAGSAPGLLGSTGPGNTSARVAHTVFFNAPLLLLEDSAHSQQEPRLHALGKTDDGRALHISFTLRQSGTWIRVISARDMHRKERVIYEQAD